MRIATDSSDPAADSQRNRFVRTNADSSLFPGQGAEVKRRAGGEEKHIPDYVSFGDTFEALGEQRGRNGK
jgi:hypothetical protein